jgi:four helix bundle protein
LAYLLTKGFPKEELYGMTAQIRQAATSIPSNIAEGWGRHYPTEFIQFLRIANGSRTELETHLIVSADVGLCPESAIQPLLQETEVLGKQFLALERSLQPKPK